MKKHKKMIARLISLATSFTLFVNGIPMTVIAEGAKGLEFPWIDLDMGSVIDRLDIFPKSDPMIIPTIHTANEFMEFLGSLDPEDYQYSTIEIYPQNTEFDLTDCGFTGLGSEEYPFMGTINYGIGGGPTFVLDRAFFNAVDISASIPGLTISRKSSETSVFTEKLTNENGYTGHREWSVVVNSLAEDLEDLNNTGKKIGSVLGNVESCDLTLNFTNAAADWNVVTNSDHIGMICSELGGGSKLTVNYTGISGYDITAAIGSAGALVGYMHDGTETERTQLIVNGGFAYSGNITAGTNEEKECSGGGIAGHAGDYCDISITEGFNCTGTVKGGSSGSAGGIAGYVGRASTVTLKSSADYTVDVSAQEYSGGLIGYMGRGSALYLSSEDGFTIGGSKIEATGEIGYSGGLIGYAEDPILELPSSEIITVSIGEIKGANAAGGLIGYAKLNSSYDFDTQSSLKVSYQLTLIGNDCGGYFGCLENNNAGAISFSGGASVTSEDIASVLGIKAENYGGMIGKYISSAISNSLVIEDMYVSSDRAAFVVTNYGGLIGSIEGPSYISLSGIKISTKDASAQSFGGIAANVGEGGSFIDINGNISVDTNGNFSTTDAAKGGAGALVGCMAQGVLRINGEVDAKKTSVEAANIATGIFVGKRENTLVYTASEGSVNAPSGVQANNIGNWGGIIPNKLTDDKTVENALVTYSAADHTVTLHAPKISTIDGSSCYELADVIDYALLSLNIQLNTEGYDLGALCFDSSEVSSDILSGTIVVTDEIDLTNKGLIGLTRDDDKSPEFTGTLIGGGNSIILDIGSGEPNSRIYTHTYNGLFAKTATSTVSNITIGGSVQVQPLTDEVYAAGLSAYHTDGTIEINGAVAAEKIKFDGHCCVGGMIANVSGGEVVFDNGCILNNEISTFTGSSTSGNAAVGGLIANVTAAKVVINDLTANGLSMVIDLGSEAESVSGSLLGYKWLKTVTEINKLRIGSEESESVPTLKVTGAASKMAGLVYRSTGYMQLKDLEFNKVNISGTPDMFGMIVCYGDSFSITEIVDKTEKTVDYALYLEQVSNDRYKIGDFSLNIGDPSVFDEYAAVTVNSRGNGVVSIPTSDGKKIYENDVNNIYHNRIKLNGTVNSKSNKNTRYYYNLYDFREKKKNGTISPGEDLLLWSVRQYSIETLNDYFLTSINNVIGGGSTSEPYEYDLEGLSYYPVSLPKSITLRNAVIKFGSRDITYENKENVVIASDAMADSENQHYGMHRGLFSRMDSTSASDRKTLNISGKVVLQGPLTNAGGTGALFCETVKGDYDRSGIDEYTSKIACSADCDLILRDLYLRGYNGGVHPLLIDHIGSYTDITISGVKTEYDESVSGRTSYYMGGASMAASSLIGTVGSTDAVSANLTFSRMKLDARNGKDEPDLSSYYNTEQSIFSRATLLESYQYESKSSGNYDFTHDEDWNANGTAKHNVTYGKEIADSIENAHEEEKYLNSSKFVSPVSSDASSVYGDFSTDYLPYVYKSYDEANRYFELKVNLSFVSLNVGCGTYVDPYIISDTATLEQLTKLLSGTKDFQSGFKINYPKDEGCDKTSEGHIEYTSDGARLVNGSLSMGKNDMREYLRESYYLITDDIVLSENFESFGKQASKSVDQIFRGVIIGRKADGSVPTISLDTHTTRKLVVDDKGVPVVDANGNEMYINEPLKPFIEVAGGCVVKDLNIVYLNPIDREQNGVERFAPESGASAGFEGCKYFGGVIGQVLAGDNIIDNVDVSFGSGVTIDISGDHDYLIPVGKYVGVVRNGGLIFRGMSGRSGLNDSIVRKADKTYITMDDEDYLYINPFIGRVLDGYAVTDDNSTINNGVQKSIGGKNQWYYKNYKINPLVKPVNESSKIYLGIGDRIMTPISNGGSNYRGYSVIHIPDGQSLFVLSCLVASGSCAMEYFDGSDSPYAYSGKNWDKKYAHFAVDSSYAIGRTHLADYDYVGIYDETVNAQKTDHDHAMLDDSTSCYSSSAKSSYKTIPYLIYYYTQDQTSDMGGLDWVTRVICASNTRYSITLSDSASASYDLSTYGNGFHGLNALFNNTSYCTNTDRQVLNIFGFNGMNKAIKLDMDVKNYGIDDSYNPYGVGLISRTEQNTDSPATHNNKIKGYDLDIGKWNTNSDLFAVKDLTLEGRVSYSPNGRDYVTDKFYNVNTGAFTGTSYSGTTFAEGSTKNHYLFENINLNIDVEGGYYSGGLIGNVETSTVDIVVNDISADKINVTGHKYSGGVIGNVTVCTNGMVIKGDPEKQFRIGFVTADAADNECGGLIGHSTIKANISDINVASYDGNEAVIGQDDSIFSGGLIGYISTGVVINGCSLSDISVNGIKCAGGLIGRFPTSQTAKISKCAVKSGNITTTNDDETNYGAGGLIGGSTGVLDITECIVGMADNSSAVRDVVIKALKNAGGCIGGYNTRSATLRGCTVTDCDIEISYTENSSNGAGGMVGKAGNAFNLEKSGDIANLVSNANISSGYYAGGVLGYSDSTSNISDITVQDSRIVSDNDFQRTSTYAIGSSAGGVIGRSSSNVNIDRAVISGNSIEANAFCGGILAFNISANDVRSNECAVRDCKIIVKTNYENDIFSGGAYGYLYRAVVNNTSVDNCEFESSTKGTKMINLSYMVGALNNSANYFNGYDLLVSNNRYTASGSANNFKIGYWMGNSNKGSVRLLGISKQKNDAPPTVSGNVDNEVGNTGRAADNYFIYADYQGSCMETERNEIGTAPYVTVNPVLRAANGDIVEIVDSSGDTLECVSGNGVSKAVVDDIINKGDGEKNYKTADGFTMDDTMTKYEGDLYEPFYVFNIENQSSSEITDMVKKYIRLLTNDKDNNEIYTNITTYGYKRVGDKLRKTNTPSIICRKENDTYTFENDAAHYDSPGGFTVIDVQYEDPSGVDGTVFHLMIPVYAKKLLQFTFRAAALPGTDYNASDYANVRQPVVSSYGSGSPITVLITFTFDRTAEEWADSINSGDNLMLGLDEYFYIKRNPKDNNGVKEFIPDGSKLTLVDKNNNGRAYTYTLKKNELVTEKSEDLLKVDLSKFADSDGNGYNKDALTLLDLLKCYGTLDKAEDEAGAFVICSEADKSSAAVILSDGTYLKPASDETSGRYNVTVEFDESKFASYEYKDFDGVMKPVVSDTFYLTIQTPDGNNDDKIVTNFLVFEDTCLEPYDELPNHNATGSLSNYSGGTLIIGNFFKQSDFSITRENDRLIDPYSNYQVKFKAETTVEILNTSDFWGYTNNLDIYHEFGVALREYVNGIGTAESILGSNVLVNIDSDTNNYKYELTVTQVSSVVDNVEQITDVNYKKYLSPSTIDYTSGQSKYYITNGSTGSIMSELQSMVTFPNKVKKFTITVYSSIVYDSNDAIKKQFPKENGNDGVTPVVVSNFAFSPDQLHNSGMTTGREELGQSSRFYRTDNVSAKLTYDEIQTGIDETGCGSHLGINALEDPKALTSSITALGSLDTTNVANISKVKRIKFTLGLKKKTDEGGTARYVDVDIDDFIDFDTVQFITTDGTVIAGKELQLVKSLNDKNVVECTYEWDSNSKKENKFDLTTEFEVYTGHNAGFEAKNDRYYANYDLELTAALYVPDAIREDQFDAIDQPTNHLVYTNSRIYYEIVP